MYFVVAAEVQDQVKQYISTALRSPEGAALVRAIASSSLPSSFAPGNLPRGPAPDGGVNITHGTTEVVPGTSGMMAGTKTILDRVADAYQAGLTGETTFSLGLKAFLH
jgi:hypothetical protein